MFPSEKLASSQFPRSNKYNPEWVIASASGGANSLWLMEWLTSAISLKTDMRVLDLGCGRGSSSIFLHREFGVEVWATDLWFSPSENLQRIRDAGMARTHGRDDRRMGRCATADQVGSQFRTNGTKGPKNPA